MHGDILAEAWHQADEHFILETNGCLHLPPVFFIKGRARNIAQPNLVIQRELNKGPFPQVLAGFGKPTRDSNVLQD